MAVTPCKYGHFSERGAQNKCLQCSRERAKTRRTENPAHVNAVNRTYYSANRDRRNAKSKEYHAAEPRKAMLRHAQKRAVKGGYPCTITLADIVVPEYCPLLGVKLQVNAGGVGPASPSLDKIRPELGYIPGNVWVVSHRANALKGDASVDELILLTENLKRRTSTEVQQGLVMPWATFGAPERMPWQ